mgnify:CR=1 FL=1
MGPVQSANNRTLTSTHLNNVIRDNINTEAFTPKSQDIHTGTDHLIPSHGIRDNTNINVETVKTTQQHSRGGAGETEFDTRQFITDPLHSEVNTPHTQLAAINLSDMKGNSVDVRMKDQQNIEMMTNPRQHRTAVIENDGAHIKLKDQTNTNVSTNQQGEYFRSNLNQELPKLENRTPITNVMTNQSGEHYKPYQYDQTKPLEQNRNHTSAYTNPLNSREEYRHNIVHGAKLQPKISPNEGFTGRATKPVEFITNTDHQLRPRGETVNKGAYNQYAERFQDARQHNQESRYGSFIQ